MQSMSPKPQKDDAVDGRGSKTSSRLRGLAINEFFFRLWAEKGQGMSSQVFLSLEHSV